MLTVVYFVQQNSVNWTSYSSEILIIWHLKRVDPRLKVLLFSRKKELCQWNRQISGTCSKWTQSVSVHQILWYLVIPCLLSNSLAMKT